jgi:hypothetical protein
MKKVYLQYWEESERGWGVRPDGCSLHISKEDAKSYTDKIYSDRDLVNIPDEYDRVVGDLIDVEVSDEIYEEILNCSNSLRLMQHSLSNLKKLQEIQTIVPHEFDN